jgi:hypothetical protein
MSRGSQEEIFGERIFRGLCTFFGKTVFKNTATFEKTVAFTSTVTFSPLPSQLAPLPQSAAGVGQTIYVAAGMGAALNFPAGGTWMVTQYALYVTATGIVNANQAAVLVGSGGSQIAPGVATFSSYAEVYRIA